MREESRAGLVPEHDVPVPGDGQSATRPSRPVRATGARAPPVRKHDEDSPAEGPRVPVRGRREGNGGPCGSVAGTRPGRSAVLRDAEDAGPVHQPPPAGRGEGERDVAPRGPRVRAYDRLT